MQGTQVYGIVLEPFFIGMEQEMHRKVPNPKTLNPKT